MQPQAAGAEYHEILAELKPRAIETPEDLRHRAIRRRGDQVGHIVGHAIEMLIGLDDVVRGEGRGEMRRLVGMARAHHLGRACGVIAADAVDASIADGVVNRRDSIAFLDRHPRPVGAHARAERLDAPAHLMPRHHAALAELALPHMHFGTAYVGLRDRRDDPTGGRRRNVVLVKFNLVSGRNKRDATFHCITPSARVMAPVSSRTKQMSSPHSLTTLQMLILQPP